MKMKCVRRIYLAGPMSGLPDHNFPAFHSETARLRALGYEVVNPAEINGHLAGKLPYIEYLRRDAAQLATCDTIAFLPGWQNSVGANKEHAIGFQLEMNMINAIDIQSRFAGTPVYFTEIEPATVGIIGKVKSWLHERFLNIRK